MNNIILEKINQLNKQYMINDKKLNLEIIYLKIRYYENKLNDLCKNRPYRFQVKSYKNFNKKINEYYSILKKLYLKVEDELEKINN